MQTLNVYVCDKVIFFHIPSYNPDLDSDPYCEDGSLWSFNYFFFNKKENKMVFFTCCATRLSIFHKALSFSQISLCPSSLYSFLPTRPLHSLPL